MLPATQTYSKSFQAIMSVILQLYMYLLLLGTAVLSLTSLSFGCVFCLFPNFYHSSLSFTYRFNSTVLHISIVLFPISCQMNRPSFDGEESPLHRKNHSCRSQRQERNQEFGSEIATCVIFPHCSDNRSNIIQKICFPKLAIETFTITKRMQ